MAKPPLDENKLMELLAEAHEHEALDYKSHLDLSDRLVELELVKDIAAFSASGGYLVIGASDGGKPTATMTKQEADLFDESRLRSKVKRYVQEPIELRTARHELNGNILVVIHVGAHPDGFVILDADGQTGDKVVFRRGDVFVRHGTASERWAPHDFGQIKEALVKRHIGIPDLVPAPPSKHEIEEPRQVQTDGVEALYQRVLVEVENVGPASARVVNCEASGYESGGSLGRVRPPAAIPPYHSRPFELNARVGNAEGLVAGTVLELKVRYEGGGHERGMHMKITYHRAGGFVNDEHSVVDDI